MGVAMLLTTGLLERSHDDDYKLIREVFEAKLNSLEDEAVEAAELAISIPSVRQAFLARDRQKLVAECRQMFAIQKEKYGLDRSEFHEPSGTTFLRLHQPEKFGDDETSRRPMLADVHRTKAVHLGIEVGSYGPAVSAIIPILDDQGKFAGSFEMALDFEPVLDELKTAFEFDGAVFIDERLLHEVATILPADATSIRSRVGPYIRLHTTHQDLMEGLVTDRDVDVAEPSSYERAMEGTTWGVQLIPLYDHSNKRIGVVSLVHNFGDDESAARRAFVWQALSALFGIVTLVGAILIVIRGQLLAPLAALNQQYSSLVQGTEAPEADPCDSYCEELQTLAKNYKELKSRRES